MLRLNFFQPFIQELRAMGKIMGKIMGKNQGSQPGDFWKCDSLILSILTLGGRTSISPILVVFAND